MIDLNYVHNFLKVAKKNNFDNWFKLTFKQQKFFLQCIVKDQRVIEFLNNTNKYISNYSQSMQWSYTQKRIMLLNLNSQISYWTFQMIDIKYLNNLLTIINFVLKKVNIPQP